MADERDDTERTEDPTPKRLEEAIKRGDVVKSAEVNTWFMIAGGTFMLMVFAPPMAASLQATFRGLLAHSWQIPADGPGLAMLTRQLAIALLSALGIPILILVLRRIGRQRHPAPLVVLGRADHAAGCRAFRRPPA